MKPRILGSLAALIVLAGCLQDPLPSNPAVTQQNAVVIPESSEVVIEPSATTETTPPTETAPNDAAVPATPKTPTTPAATPPAGATPVAETPSAKQPEWQALFDGKSLKNWKSTEFGGEGEVEVKDGQIVLNFGSDMTGITWSGGELPKTDYELVVEAMRVDGTDFFAGLTFPCNDSSCSFIPGGWGGGVVGISSIDGMDASENATTTYQSFEKGRWYTLRVRVTKPKIEAWIDKLQVVDTVIAGRKISIRGEVELSKPLGISTWSTQGAIKSIKLRKLTADEVAAAEKSAKETDPLKKE